MTELHGPPEWTPLETSQITRPLGPRNKSFISQAVQFLSHFEAKRGSKVLYSKDGAQQAVPEPRLQVSH